MNKHHIIISQHGVSYLKYIGEFFSKSNFFMGEIKPFWVNLWGEGGGFLHGGNNARFMPSGEWGEFHKKFFQ